MSSEAELDRLCGLYGIADAYTDIWGGYHRVSYGTRRALLAAMGVDASDPVAVSHALVTATERPWRQVLPPVKVVAQDERELRLQLYLPERLREETLRWTMLEEGGGRWEEQLRPSQLAATETRELDGQTFLRYELKVTMPENPGYHRLELAKADGGGGALAATSVIVAPSCCYLPEALRDDARSWGLITQLHAVRSRRNWGIGDFTDLTRLIELAAEAGAGTLGLTPLHSLFHDEPQRCDPYAPSSRLFLNVLHLDVSAIQDYGECEEARVLAEGDTFQAQLRALRAAELVDYPAVEQAKMEVLQQLYRHFREHHLDASSPRGQAFRNFQDWQGAALRRFCLFHALREHFSKEGGSARPWPEWPAAFHSPDSQAVADFAAEHGERIAFFGYLQWQASQQLQGVGRRSWELGLAVGLYQDLAAGVTADSADAWGEQAVHAHGVQGGAPPDGFSPTGQCWGLLPWDPARLREAAYAPFIASLRQNMRDAGALRIDHVMGLRRLYWIPDGMDASEGGYVAYPFDEMLGILALESQRNQCVVVGEDLGTVPDGIRDALKTRGVLCSRVLYFEREASGGFRPPAEYEPQAVASIGTHDLPPIAAFWQGTDLETRRALQLFPNGRYQEAVLQRAADRSHLLLALQGEGLLPEGIGVDPITLPELPPSLVHAVHLYLARSPSRLMLVQLENAFGQTEQVNLPGSGQLYPNWQRRLPLDLEEWSDQPALSELLSAVCGERGPAVHAPPAPPASKEAFVPPRAQIPRATYRLQLHAGFTFSDAAALVPYLARLGISHCYLSPYLKARPGSTHGYDVVAHDRLNPELGSREDFDRLCEILKAHHMGQIMDLVPNHVGVMGRENEKWTDVLENGPASPFSTFFDIDWAPLKQELHGKVLLPVLGDHYGNLLDRGELKLAYDGGSFFVTYYEHHFPVDPREYPRILGPGVERFEERLGDNPVIPLFESLISAFANLPPRSDTSEEATTERRRDKELHKQRLDALRIESPDINWYIQECLREYNGSDQYPAHTGRLHELLEAQAYRLAYWRVAADEINYRRFFDINDLAALRMENPEAFAAVHQLPFELIAEGKVQGLRIDHPDGLYDPAEYFRHIQAQVTAANGTSKESERAKRPLYLVAEKILVGDEQLPRHWPVHGTTGYDFAALADGLLVAADNAEAMSEAYEAFVPDALPLAEHVYRAKKLVMRNLLSSELHVLVTELSRIAETDPHTRDYTLEGLRNALTEIVVCFPVYRSYADAEGVSARDQANINRAVAEAKRRSSAVDLTVFDFVREVLIERATQGKSQAYRDRVIRFAMKFQQYTSPVMAKGLEDTAYYRYHRLVSLNEVGGAPERFGLSVEAFHRANQRRRDTWPHTLLAASTHDTKRSEDVRARLHVISELPEDWRARVDRWTVINRRFKREIDGRMWPDENTEYLLYQTLLGVWPLAPLEGDAPKCLRERVIAYMEKAIKEAKANTSWINPNEDYEAAVAYFVDALLDPARNGYFLADFLPFQQRIARIGLFNSLSLTLLRLTAPGVPDTYQGTELWDYSLVDPDNRRPVDFGLRISLLEDLERRFSQDEGLSERVGELLNTMTDGRAKLYLVWRCLGLRREYPELFEGGDYLPLEAMGEGKDRLCVFARRDRRHTIVAVAPRLLAGLSEDGRPFENALWSQTLIEVPARRLRNLLTGERLTARSESGGYVLAAAEVLERFPVGLLLEEAAENA